MRGVTQDSTFYSQVGYDTIGQWDNWQNLLDMANAVRYGFSQYRLPKPGEVIDILEAQIRVGNIDLEWAKEHSHRGDSNEKPCPEFQKCSVEAQCYLHNILEANVPIGNDEELYYGFDVYRLG